MKQTLLSLTLLAVAVTASAQSSVTFATSSEATGLNYAGSWGAANHTTETLDAIDWGAAKGNSLAVEGHQLIAPSFNFNSYLGGVRVTPDISALLKPTNISPDQFGLYIQAAGGVSTLKAGNQLTALVGGGANYRLTTNLAWTTVDAHWLRIGNMNAWEMSTGLEYIFNPNSTQSMATKRFLLHRAMKR